MKSLSQSLADVYQPGVRIYSVITGRTGTVCEPFGQWNGPVVHVQWDDGDRHIALPHCVRPLPTVIL